jgi:hypothetical protein
MQARPLQSAPRTSPHTGEIMKYHVLALVALAAVGFSGAAFAEDATATTGPVTMTDSELDGVAAGTTGQGIPPAHTHPRAPARA